MQDKDENLKQRVVIRKLAKADTAQLTWISNGLRL